MIVGPSVLYDEMNSFTLEIHQIRLHSYTEIDVVNNYLKSANFSFVLEATIRYELFLATSPFHYISEAFYVHPIIIFYLIKRILKFIESFLCNLHIYIMVLFA